MKKPVKTKIPVLAQLCKLIPQGTVSKLARKHGIDQKARTFTPWSHVVTLIYAQLTHAIGVNDVCDALRNHRRWLGSIRGAVAPARNTLSHANKNRLSNFMWDRIDLEELLRSYGTAGGSSRFRACPESVCLPGLAPPGCGTA